MKFILFLALLLFFQRALGDLICEELPVEMCTLSIDSSGKRCVLESTTSGEEGKFEMQCQTSEVFASNKRLQEYIETDECVGACGVDRQSLGLSSDSLLDSKFISKLCSHQCYNNCPNIVDLYSNLASAEGGAGVSLPEMCSSQKTGLGRGTSKLLSSGAAAPGGYGGGQVSAAAPSQDAAAPSQNDGAPAAPVGYGGGQDAAAPQNAEAPPPQNAEAPSQNYAAPSQDAAAPSQNAEAPSQDAAAPPPSQY